MEKRGKNKDKKGFFKSNYKKSWDVLKENKWFVVIGFLIFCISYIVGLFFPVFFREEIFQIMQDLVSIIEGMSAPEMVGFIFFNNLRVAFISVVFGIIFALFPVFGLVQNGYLIGFVSNISVSQAGLGVLWRLFPHGIFELPAVIIAMGLGLRLGFDSLKNFIDYYNKIDIKKRLKLLLPLVLIFVIAMFLMIYNIETSQNSFQNMFFLSGSILLFVCIFYVSGVAVFSFVQSKKSRQRFKDMMIFFLFVILPLLLIAAFIEGILIFSGV